MNFPVVLFCNAAFPRVFFSCAQGDGAGTGGRGYRAASIGTAKF
jgi:hypothetical protein